MKPLNFVFPAGLPGAGLLVLRLSVALILVVSVARQGFPAPAEAAGACLSIAVLAGLFTRAAAALCVLLACLGWCTLGGIASLPIAHCGLQAVALALLGGGAYSADARLFGRRVIRIRP